MTLCDAITDILRQLVSAYSLFEVRLRLAASVRRAAVAYACL
jgi:hypothetical protein